MNNNNDKFECEDEEAMDDQPSNLLFDIPFITDSTHFLQENNNNNANNHASGSNANPSFGSTGSLSDFLETRNNNPSLESLIVNVVGDIKKKKENSYVVIPPLTS